MDKSDTLKLCPRLKESMLHPTHFQKMNVRLSASLLNSDVAAAISFYVNQNILEKSNETTANPRDATNDFSSKCDHRCRIYHQRARRLLDFDN
jgi:hypothetical protein